MKGKFVFLCVICLVSPWVIYRRNQKRKLICKEENEWSNSTSDAEQDDMPTIRRVRDVDVDPIHKEPIIYLGTRGNSSVFIDDGDFDIVSDQLTSEELAEVKRQIMNTCNALNSN
ncbi:unnamed protein product [Auanema sp. JU1783]|nr:unnamed protein product [Auanema sp. JU1783]